MANLSDFVGFALTVTIRYKKELSDFVGFALTVTIRYNHQIHQIAQIRHVEPQKQQYTTTEVGLHLF